MKAVIIDRFGGPEVLEVRDIARPEPGPGQVRVAVRACGVCRHDLLTRAGAFPDIALPVVPGHQICGEVDAVGDGVVGLRPGMRVLSMIYETCGRCRACRSGREPRCERRPVFIGEDVDGGYAEYVVASERAWVSVPDSVTDVQGAVITCTLGTSFHAIVTRGRARAGEWAVVTGASGGVGLHALQILDSIGVRTIGVTSSPAKKELLRKAGATDVVVSGPDGGYARQVKEVTDGRGVDLAIEIVGGVGITESLHCLRTGGRSVLVGNVQGGTATIKPAHFILKEISLIGTKAITHLEMQDLLGLISRGVLAPHVEATLPLGDAREAHERMAEGRAAGRLVLVP